MRRQKLSCLLGGAVPVLLVGTLSACGGSSGGGATHSSDKAGSSASTSRTTQRGEAGKSSSQVLRDSKSALFNARSVHVTGTVTSHGQPEKLDLWFAGQNTAGTESVSGTVVHIVKIGDTAFLKAPKSFWEKTAGAKAAPLADRWIKSAGAASGNFSALTLQGLAASINTNDSPLRPGVGHTTVAGKKALVLTQQDGSKLYVADANSPLPLRMVNTGASKGSVDFSDYGAKHQITAPKGAVNAQQALAGSHPSSA